MLRASSTKNSQAACSRFSTSFYSKNFLSVLFLNSLTTKAPNQTVHLLFFSICSKTTETFRNFHVLGTQKSAHTKRMLRTTNFFFAIKKKTQLFGFRSHKPKHALPTIPQASSFTSAHTSNPVASNTFSVVPATDKTKPTLPRGCPRNLTGACNSSKKVNIDGHFRHFTQTP